MAPKITFPKAATGEPPLTQSQQNHNDAVMVPGKRERPVLQLVQAWANYADAHQLWFGQNIGDDPVMGAAWIDMSVDLLTLLGGERGRLDGGALDKFIRDTVKHHGGNIDDK